MLKLSQLITTARDAIQARPYFAGEPVVIDFQLLGSGTGAYDIAYFVTQSLFPTAITLADGKTVGAGALFTSCAVGLILTGVLALTAVMYMSTPKELAPEEDQGFLLHLVKTPQYGNLDYLEKTTGDLKAVLDTIPEVDHIFAIDAVAVSSVLSSSSSMQRSTKTRITCVSVASSASLKRVFWKLATGLPKALRSFT